MNRCERNPSFELWRCFCMLAVVFSHILANNGLVDFGWFRWHIPGFLILSGYFGIRLRPSKIISLVAMAYACYFLTIPFRDFSNLISLRGLILLSIPHGGWFLPYYLVLMLLSPIFKEATLRMGERKRELILPLVTLMIFGWLVGGSANPHIGMMRIAGMQGSGLLLMMGLYLIMQAVRQSSILTGVRSRLILVGTFGFILFAILGGLMSKLAVGLSTYGNPFSIAAAICGFVLFSQLKMPNWIARIILWISPSIFPIYLLHECCLRTWQKLPESFVRFGISGAFVWAIVIFVMCLTIDLVRRGIVRRLLQPYVEPLFSKLDAHYEEFIQKSLDN